MKPTTYLVLDTRRKKKNGKYPLKVRVVFNRVAQDYKTGHDLTEDEYANACLDKPKQAFKDLNVKLVALRKRTNDIIEENKHFTFQAFADAFYGRIKDASNIFPFFDEYIQQLRSEERIKTAFSYESAKKSLQAFKSKLGFYDLTPTLLKQYHRQMIDKGKTETTIGIYLRTLRSIYNYAITLGIIKRGELYPFGKRKYVIPAGRNVKKALSLDEIQKIYNYKPNSNMAEAKAKAFFIFSYLCNGMNFKDIALLKYANIDGDMVRYKRSKTKHSSQANAKIISCFISKDVKDIIKTWGNKKVTDDTYLFDVLAVNDSAEKRVRKIDQFIKNTNQALKNICVKIGINKAVTTYYCRHSFATILKRNGYAIEKISEALGHSSLAVTENYLDSFDDATKMNISASLLNF